MARDPGQNFTTGDPGYSGAATPAGRSAGPVRRDEAVHLCPAATAKVHDLRNALTVVLGSLEQLRRQPLDRRGQEQRDRAEWGTRHAGRLARELLSASPDEEAAAAIVDLNEVVRAFAASVGERVGSVRLAVDLAPGTLPARFDPAELERALLDLVRNAADVASDGGGVTIRTAGHALDGLGNQPTVEVAVSDTGSGKALEAVRRATEAFYTTQQQGRGAGLSLWKVRHFAEEADGKVEIETARAQGATVRITLPRA